METITVFRINRRVDISGVSGTGVVAFGTEYPNGKVTLSWNTKFKSVAVYDSMQDVIEIHCHGDSSVIEVVNVIRNE